jgi:hypothetical protein
MIAEFDRSFQVKHGRWFVVATLLLAAVACFWPLVRHPSDQLVGVQQGGFNDLVTFYFPYRDLPRVILARYGQWPFWNPWLGTGGPHLGDPQSALFYPLSWPFWLVGVRGWLSWSFVVHHLLGGMGTYGLCRRLGLSRLGAACAGVAFLGSPVLLARSGEGQTCLSVMVWAPWAFWMYERERQGARHGVAGLVTVLALAILAGHSQEAYYLVIALSLMCLYDALRLVAAGQRSGAAQRIGRWVIVGLGTAGLAAVDLVPSFLYTRAAAEGYRLLRARLAIDCAGPENLQQLLHPFALGGPATYTGPGHFFWETLCYFGVAAEILAVLGLISSLRSSRRIGPLAVVGAVGLAVAFRNHTPVYPLLEHIIPGLGLFRYPSRILFLTALAVAVLAGAGIDAIAAARFSGRFRTDVLRTLLALAIVVVGLNVVALRPGNLELSITPDSTEPLSAWDEALAEPAPLLALAATVVVLALVARRPRWGRPLALALVGLILAEQAMFARAILRTVPLAEFRKDSPATAFLESRAKGSRVLSEQIAFSDSEAEWHGIRRLTSYQPIPLAANLAMFEALQLKAPGVPPMGFRPFNLIAVPPASLDLLGVRYVVRLGLDRLPRDRSGWRLATSGRLRNAITIRGQTPRSFDFEVRENLGALPRGFVVGLACLARPGQTLDQAVAAHDPRKEVVLDGDVLPPGPRQGFTPARLIEDTPNRVGLEVETSLPGYLVLSDTWYPGWSATVDGHRSPVLKADLALRAVALPNPGRHRVVFNYWPVGFTPALVVSALTALTLVASVVKRGDRETAGGHGHPVMPGSVTRARSTDDFADVSFTRS